MANGMGWATAWVACGLLAACVANPEAPKAVSKRVPAKDVAIAGADAASTVVANHGGGIVSNNASRGLIGNDGAGLIATGGGNMVGKGGSTLPFANSVAAGQTIPGDSSPLPSLALIGKVSVPTGWTAAAPWRLLTLPDVEPAAGVTVRLVDAAGTALANDAGEKYLAVTAPDGLFTFASFPAGRGFVAIVDVGERGPLRTLVTRDFPLAEGVDLDVVNALAAAYVLDRYVAGQEDRDAALNRLTAKATANVTTLLRVTLAASRNAPPENVGAETARQVVTEARDTAPSLAAALDELGLLVAAGTP